MRRKYLECIRDDGDCTVCSLVSHGRDCRDRNITPLEWHRLAVQMTQQELAEASGVNVRQIRRVEIGEAQAGNLTAKNLLAIAKVLNVDPESLI